VDEQITFSATKKIPKPVHVNFHTRNHGPPPPREECPLCTIPLREPLLYEDDLIYLVSTNKMKGHKVRVMAVTKLHEEEPTFEERIRCTIKLYEYMRRASKTWFMVDDTFCSLPLHFHLMACDTLGSADPMLYQTPRVRFPLGKLLLETEV
jgi:hypothetical protein